MESSISEVEVQLHDGDQYVEFAKNPHTRIKLPELRHRETVSKLVTMEKKVNHKWLPPQCNSNIVTRTRKFVAYTLRNAKTNCPMVKIYKEDEMDMKAIIKNFKGEVFRILFKERYDEGDEDEDEDDDVFVILSILDNVIYMSFHTIIENDKKKLDNALIAEVKVCDISSNNTSPLTFDIIPGIKENIAVVAVATELYLVGTDEENGSCKQLDCCNIDKPIVSVHLHQEKTMVACTVDGVLYFVDITSSSAAEEKDDPFEIFEEKQKPVVQWTGYVEADWTVLAVVTDTSVLLYSLEKFLIISEVKFSNKDWSREIRCCIEESGRYLVLSSGFLKHLLVFEILRPEPEHTSFDVISKLYCYPMRNELLDVTYKGLQCPQVVPGRYEVADNGQVLELLVVTCNALSLMRVLFDFRSIPDATVEPVTVHSRVGQLELIPRIQSPVSLPQIPIPQPPTRHSPLELSKIPTSPEDLQLPAPSAFLINPKPAETEAQPLDTPRRTPHPGLSRSSVDLMPTPLPTPQTEEEAADPNDTSPKRRVSQHNMKLLIQGLTIDGEDTPEAAQFEVEVHKFMETHEVIRTSEFMCDIIEFYQNSIILQQLPTFHKILSKYLLLYYLYKPESIRELLSNYRISGLDEDFCVFLGDVELHILQPELYATVIHYLASLLALVRQLYENGIYGKELMLRLLERLIKSYFSFKDVVAADELVVWEEILLTEVALLQASIEVMDGSDNKFKQQVNGILEVLKIFSPMTVDSEEIPQHPMESSRTPPSEVSPTPLPPVILEREDEITPPLPSSNSEDMTSIGLDSSAVLVLDPPPTEEETGDNKSLVEERSTKEQYAASDIREEHKNFKIRDLKKELIVMNRMLDGLQVKVEVQEAIDQSVDDIKKDKQKQVWSKLAQSAIDVLKKQLKKWLHEYLVVSLNKQLDEMIKRQDSLAKHVEMNRKKEDSVRRRCHDLVNEMTSKINPDLVNHFRNDTSMEEAMRSALLNSFSSIMAEVVSQFESVMENELRLTVKQLTEMPASSRLSEDALLQNLERVERSLDILQKKTVEIQSVFQSSINNMN